MAIRQTENESMRRTIFALRAFVILMLISGGWWFYHSLPAETAEDAKRFSRQQNTNLQIVWRVREANRKSIAGASVQLFAVDVAAVQREYLSERQAGIRFEDFITRRMKSRPPLAAKFDEQGTVRLQVAHGRWWIHLTREVGDEELMWRLPVNVRGESQVVELTPENAYTRTREF